MYQITVKEQINIIDKVTQEALKSKESAHQFLLDAGIIKEEKATNYSNNKKK